MKSISQRGIAPIAVLLIALAVIGVGVLAVRGTRTVTTSDVDSRETSSVATTPSQTTSAATPTVSTSTPATTTTVAKSTTKTYHLDLSDLKDDAVIVTYDANGFSPKEITVNKGQLVRFENSSGKSFWPASNDHPSHLLYSEFDSKQRIPNLGFYEFTFTKIGTWKYHDHINASKGGTVIVK